MDRSIHPNTLQGLYQLPDRLSQLRQLRQIATSLRQIDRESSSQSGEQVQLVSRSAAAKAKAMGLATSRTHSINTLRSDPAGHSSSSVVLVPLNRLKPLF
jgi:hypothetical protein